MAQLTCLSFLTLQEITGEAESVRGPKFVRASCHPLYCNLCGFQNLSEPTQEDSPTVDHVL